MTKSPGSVSRDTDGVNGDWLPGSQTATQTHTVMPRRSKLQGKIAGWSDWAWLTGGHLGFTLPAQGLILPRQPCRFPCSRPLTGSRKRPGMSVSCPGSAALRLMTPTALRWHLRSQHAFLAVWEVLFSIRRSALEIPAQSLSRHVSRLSHFLSELILPSYSNLALFPDLCIWHGTGGRLCGYQGDAIWPPRASAQHSSPRRLWEAALTNWPAPCLSAAHWDSTVPLWQILLFTQQRLGHVRHSELLLC